MKRLLILITCAAALSTASCATRTASLSSTTPRISPTAELEEITIKAANSDKVVPPQQASGIKVKHSGPLDAIDFACISDMLLDGCEIGTGKLTIGD